MRIPYYRPEPDPPAVFAGQPLPLSKANWVTRFFYHWKCTPQGRLLPAFAAHRYVSLCAAPAAIDPLLRLLGADG